MAGRIPEMKIAVSMWNKPKIDLPGGYFVTLAKDAPTLLILLSILSETKTFEARKIFWRLYRWEAKEKYIPPSTLTEAIT